MQANHGGRKQLRIAGVPIGKLFEEADTSKSREMRQGKSSIIIIIATDAPLLPHQLKRLARRASLGLARSGSISANTSGDIFLAFSTARTGSTDRMQLEQRGIKMVSNDAMNALFESTVHATDEAIINALVAADSMTGYEGKTVEAIDHGYIKRVMTKYHHSLFKD